MATREIIEGYTLDRFFRLFIYLRPSFCVAVTPVGMPQSLSQADTLPNTFAIHLRCPISQNAFSEIPHIFIFVASLPLLVSLVFSLRGASQVYIAPELLPI